MPPANRFDGVPWRRSRRSRTSRLSSTSSTTRRCAAMTGPPRSIPGVGCSAVSTSPGLRRWSAGGSMASRRSAELRIRRTSRSNADPARRCAPARSAAVAGRMRPSGPGTTGQSGELRGADPEREGGPRARMHSSRSRPARQGLLGAPSAGPGVGGVFQQHLAVADDRLSGVRSSWRSSATASAVSSPFIGRAEQRLDLVEQPLQLDRLGVVVVAARRHRLLAIAGHRVRGERDDRDGPRLRSLP